MRKFFQFLATPIAILYGGILSFRNYLFDKKIFKSDSFNFPVICVGNLAVGGTGKTPMVEYLLVLLKEQFVTATLSRGYKRKTKGFAIANAQSSALEIGDEPMQFHQKFPDITVAVGEERVVAIPQLLYEKPDTQVIILDDAFQHRQVTASLNILLTEYYNLYSTDRVLPAGRLRDVTSSSKRADIIVVTKCPHEIKAEKKEAIIKSLDKEPHQKIFFTEILYAQPVHLFNGQSAYFGQETEAVLICGIANPKPLKLFLHKHLKSFVTIELGDHHIFTSDDLAEIKKRYAAIQSTHKMILTTEKDGVRLQKFKLELQDFPIYVLPIHLHFLFDETEQFNQLIFESVNKFANSASTVLSS